MAKEAATGLTEPGEYEVILKEVRVQRFSEQRGKTGQRLSWTFAVDGGDYDKQRIHVDMALRDGELPWSVCKALRAFGIDPDGQRSFEADRDGRPTDPKLAPGARARATITKDRSGNTSVRLVPAA